MQLFISLMLLCFAVLAPTVAVAQTDSIESTNTNLIVLCAGESDVAAHAKVSNLEFVRKPADPNVFDLSVYGRLYTLNIKQVYLRGDTFSFFPTNIYLYRGGAIDGDFSQPRLKVGREYLVFLKQVNIPEIVRAGVITDPPLPTTNYFAFVHLPERQTPNCRAYVQITDTNALASAEKCLSESPALRRHKTLGTNTPPTRHE